MLIRTMYKIVVIITNQPEQTRYTQISITKPIQTNGNIPFRRRSAHWSSRGSIPRSTVTGSPMSWGTVCGSSVSWCPVPGSHMSWCPVTRSPMSWGPITRSPMSRSTVSGSSVSWCSAAGSSISWGPTAGGWVT